ncbi:MAG: FAD-dependent oxidoreductase [Candidatus Magnetobacterium sp. LHC-1]|uniref:FAD-dependent oxidoreductase n=1 Tax=Candidatus Magnetobacterium casense TaxID=1455061 RepID=A0ABS6RYK9_9BACT|nr:FAD-dependent oxidoreductase [Candidatus Magnetobacterium casensis]MBF0607906.1 FAD-dependent oxidoreductase [Nitrospirota bacterium]MBV6340878.1 FAD-dependent oxidoreductase [Candidatus Magnetobacterium casensis]
MIDRRTFLKALGVVTAGLYASNVSIIYASDVIISDWSDGDCEDVHRIGKDKFETPDASIKKDVVIIGGGLSGLTMAYYLRDDDFMLLEKDSDPGGNAKKGKYGDTVYATGSAYLVDVERYYGKLYSELGLELKPIPNPVDTAKHEGRWVDLEDGPMKNHVKRLKKHMKKLLDGEDFPSIPIEDAKPNTLRLDKVSFYDYLKGLHYPEDYMAYIDAYCYSALGGSIREISAYAGVNFYSEIAGNIYAFPGGNAYVVDRLIEKIGTERIKTKTTVYSVKQKGSKVLTSFMEDGLSHTVESKAVVMCVPYFFAPKIVDGITGKQKKDMESLRYGAYLVANLCFDRRVFSGGYDNCMPDNSAFTDFIDAAYVANTKKEQSVITVYAPYKNPSNGRKALREGDRNSIAKDIRAGIAKAFDFPPESLKEIRLTRYGHQLLTSEVGIVHKLRGIKKSVGSNIVFAHSDGQAMAAVESAVTEARRAMDKVKRIIKQTK